MDKESKPDEKIRPFPLYGMLICGILIFIIGLYLHFTDTGATGRARPRYGGGGQITITGAGAIVLGVMILIFPAYQLIKQRKIKE